jgi:hypothetical protein
MTEGFSRIHVSDAISAFQGLKTGAYCVFLRVKSGAAPVLTREKGSKINPNELRQNNRRHSSIHLGT